MYQMYAMLWNTGLVRENGKSPLTSVEPERRQIQVFIKGMWEQWPALQGWLHSPAPSSSPAPMPGWADYATEAAARDIFKDPHQITSLTLHSCSEASPLPFLPFPASCCYCPCSFADPGAEGSPQLLLAHSILGTVMAAVAAAKAVGGFPLSMVLDWWRTPRGRKNLIVATSVITVPTWSREEVVLMILWESKHLIHRNTLNSINHTK